MPSILRTTTLIRILLLLTVVASLLGVSPAPVLAQAGAPQRDYSDLISKVQETGALRIIVELRLPDKFMPEGYLTPDEVKAQRQAIKDVESQLQRTLINAGVFTYKSVYASVPYVALEVDAETLVYLSKLEIVSNIQEDLPVPAALASSTPVIGAPTVWESGYSGSGWAVAVLDTGVQWDHAFFGGAGASRVVSEACYSSTVPGTAATLCPNGTDSQTTGHAADPTTAACLDGGDNLCTHGSHVAGIAAGDGPAYDGVAPEADIIGIQIFSRFDSESNCGVGQAPCVLTYTSDQMDGLQRVYNLRSTYQIASVNMSLGGGVNTVHCDGDARKAIIDNLLSVGIATIIATGNDGYTNAIGAPACISTAVAVGATTDADTVASFSNSNNLVDLLAPGVSIDSSIPPSTYANFQGTSMATPHVAGAWALIKSAVPGATPAQILAALTGTGVLVTDTRNSVTKPRIQVDAAAANLKPVLTWVGNTSAWSMPTNWSTGALPDGISTVSIPAAPSGGSFPLVDAGGSIYDLTIQTGAVLTMTGGTLNIYGDLTTQAGGSFNASGGTALFQGAQNQTVSMPDDAANQLFHLQVGDGASGQTLLLGSALDVNGDLTISAGAGLNPGSYSLSVAGNWTDAEGGFVPGTSTTLLDGSGGQTAQISAAALTLLNETFSAYDDMPFSYFTYDGPAGWSVENTSGGNYPMFFVGWADAPNTGLNGHARHYYSASSTSWLFTPPLTLYTGVTYNLEFKYGVNSGARSVRVGLGAAATSAAMTTTLRDFSASNTTWSTDASTFSVPADGTYYLGFRANTTTPGIGLALDDISVSAAPNLIFYNLVVNTPGAGAALAENTLVQNNLTINSGGHLALGDYALMVNGTLTNNGSLSQTKPAPGATTTQFLRVTNVAGNTTKYYGVDLTPASAMGATTVLIKGNQAACTDVPGDPLLTRCFEILPATPVSATVRFWFTEAERNGQSANGLRAWHNNGGPSWTQVGSNYTYSESGAACLSGSGAACWFQADNISTYSPFGVGSGSTPTAVTLNYLRATPASGSILLVGLALLAGAGLLLAVRPRRRSKR